MKSKLDVIGGRFDLNLLVVFDAIYRSRNLTIAGQTIGLSQPAMSHALGRLRAMFKDPLFLRLPRTLQPTPFADDLAPAVLTGLAAIRGGLQRGTFDAATTTRIFKLGIGDIAEVVHLPELLQEAHAQAPNCSLHTVEIPGSRLRDALSEGEVDVATGDYDLGASCRHVPLYESSYACVVRADHPYIASRLSLKQYKSTRHVLVAPRGAFHHGETIERVLRSRKVNARIAVHISHFHAVAALITSSDLIATIPARLAHAIQRSAAIKVLPPPIPLPKIRVSLYWHERFHREPGNVWMRGIYTKVLKR